MPKLRFSTIGRNVSIEAPLSELPSSDAQGVLHSLLERFAPPKGTQAWTAYQKAADMVLASAAVNDNEPTEESTTITSPPAGKEDYDARS